MSINIVGTRIDNRLVHGQVANVWLTYCHTNLCIVVDDETAGNPILKEIMKTTVETKGVGIRFFTTEKAINTINRAAPNQFLYIVAKEPKTICSLVKNGIPITNCNVGNMHFSEGKKRYKEDHVYVDDNDLKDFEYLKRNGVKLIIQMTPNSLRIEI